MRFDNCATDRQSYSHAALLCGDKRLKQPRGDIWTDANTRVGNADENHAIFGRTGGDNNFTSVGGVHRFKSIPQQIDQDLLN